MLDLDGVELAQHLDARQRQHIAQRDRAELRLSADRTLALRALGLRAPVGDVRRQVRDARLVVGLARLNQPLERGQVAAVNLNRVRA